MLSEQSVPACQRGYFLSWSCLNIKESSCLCSLKPISQLWRIWIFGGLINQVWLIIFLCSGKIISSILNRQQNYHEKESFPDCICWFTGQWALSDSSFSQMFVPACPGLPNLRPMEWDSDFLITFPCCSARLLYFHSTMVKLLTCLRDTVHLATDQLHLRYAHGERWTVAVIWKQMWSSVS